MMSTFPVHMLGEVAGSNRQQSEWHQLRLSEDGLRALEGPTRAAGAGHSENVTCQPWQLLQQVTSTSWRHTLAGLQKATQTKAISCISVHGSPTCRRRASVRLVTSMRPALVLPKSISTACTAFAAADCEFTPQELFEGPGTAWAETGVSGVEEPDLGAAHCQCTAACWT